MDLSQLKTALPRRSREAKMGSDNPLITEWGSKLLQEVQETNRRKKSQKGGR